MVAAWTHPSKYDSEGGCSEDLDDFLENGSHLDCSLATPSYSIGFFNSEISLSQSNSLTMRILSTWSTSGIHIYESWVVTGDHYSGYSIDSPIELRGNPNGLGSG